MAHPATGFTFYRKRTREPRDFVWEYRPCEGPDCASVRLGVSAGRRWT